MPKMSVIVLNWNGKHFLETCLTALRHQTFEDFETILVDNGSEDGSVEYVRHNFPEVSVLPLGQNLGFAAGNNVGYQQARGELIVLLNNDTEVDRHWLDEINKAVERFPHAGTFASKMLYFDERTRIDNCGFNLNASGSTIDLGRGQNNGAEWAESFTVFGACGGAAAYRQSMLEEVGFFDADFFVTYEDVDLSFRAQLRGYECVFVPEAIVYHHYRATMKNYPAKQAYFSQRNIEFIYLKNMPLGLMLRYLPWRIVYEFGAALYFTRMGVGKVFFKAKFDVLRHLPMILEKRKNVQKHRIISNTALRAKMPADRLRTKWKKFWSVWRRPMRSSVQDFPSTS